MHFYWDFLFMILNYKNIKEILNNLCHKRVSNTNYSKFIKIIKNNNLNSYILNNLWYFKYFLIYILFVNSLNLKY